MTDWQRLTARAGRAGHHLVAWLMWDPAAITRFGELGVPNGAGWLIAWRVAPLGDMSPAAVASTTYSIHPDVIAAVLRLIRSSTTSEETMRVLNESVAAGLDDVAPGLGSELAPLANDLWRGVDAVGGEFRPLFAAHRAEPRPSDPALSAWRAANCLRELRGDVHWSICAAHDLNAVEVGLLHSTMVDSDEYGGEEWIARSRGWDDDAIGHGWERLASKGWAADQRLTDEGRAARHGIEQQTDELTSPAWMAVGEDSTRRFCEAIEVHES
ncbi:MAG: SCO6745 family protein, partial [Ilumatobacteraceae bacterium]